MKFSFFDSHPNKTSAGKQWKMKPRSLECRWYPYTVKRNQSLRMSIHNTPLSTEKQRTRTRLRNEIRVRRIEAETAAWHWLVRQPYATGVFLRPAKLIGGCDCMKRPDRTPCGISSPAEVPPSWTVVFTNGSVVEFMHPILNATYLAYIEGIYSWIGAQGSNTKWCGKKCSWRQTKLTGGLIAP